MTMELEAYERPAEMPVAGPALPKRGNAVTRWLAQTIMRLFGWRIEGEVPNEPKVILVGAPHTSNWDMFLALFTAMSIGVEMHYVIKHTVVANPVGAFLKWTGAIGVNRGTTKDFVQTMVDVFDEHDKFVLAIMPEGTRSKVPGWRSGFYYIAHNAGAPLCLVLYDYDRKVMGLGPILYTSGDYEADLPRIQAYYEGIRGKRGKQVEVTQSKSPFSP